jgi:hypothetical protein
MTTNDLSKEFGVGVSYALTAFQVIEESLKLYITYSFKLIRIRLDKSIPFEFSGKDYESVALETLIKIFSKLSDNQELITRLRKVTDERNYVAHQALVKYLGGPEDGSHHDEHSKRITSITVEAWACLAVLQQDLAALDKRIMG